MLAEERQMLWGLYRRVVILRDMVQSSCGSPLALYTAGSAVCLRYESIRLELMLLVGITLPGVQDPYPDGCGRLSQETVFGQMHRTMLHLEEILCPHQMARQLPPVITLPSTFCA